MIKAVVFDFDDTLVLESEYIKSGFWVVSEYIEENYKIDLNTVFEELNDLIDEDKKNVFNRFLDKRNIKYSDDDIKKIVNIYKTHKPCISFVEGAIQIISFLKEKNIKVGIISDGNAITQKLKLEAVNAYDVFDEIILTDELGRDFWKPNIKAFEMMKDRFNIEFNEMIYVGDNPEKDFYIGRYGIKTVRVYNEKGIYLDKEYKENLKENYKIYELSEIKNYI